MFKIATAISVIALAAVGYLWWNQTQTQATEIATLREKIAQDQSTILQLSLRATSLDEELDAALKPEYLDALGLLRKTRDICQNIALANLQGDHLCYDAMFTAFPSRDFRLKLLREKPEQALAEVKKALVERCDLIEGKKPEACTI